MAHASTILEWLPSEMLYEIATAYRMPCISLYHRRLRADAFGHGVARLMAMTCKTMQQVVGRCISPLNGHPIGAFVIYWYAWFATIGDRPLLREHLLFERQGRGAEVAVVGLRPDADRHWLASSRRLVDSERVASFLIDATVYAQCWDMLALLVPPPYSLGKHMGAAVFMASLLVDIPGRPGMRHITDDARLDYVRVHWNDRPRDLITAFSYVAETPSAVDGLCRLAIVGIETDSQRMLNTMMGYFSAALMAHASLPLLSAIWTRLQLGKLMRDASPPARTMSGTSIWMDLVRSAAGAPVYEWFHKSVYPCDDIIAHINGLPRASHTVPAACSKCLARTNASSLLVYIGPNTPIDAIKWMQARGQSVDDACPGCGTGLFANAMRYGNLPVARWAIAHTRDLGLPAKIIGALIHADSFTMREIEQIYEYAMEQATKAGPTVIPLRHFGDWIEGSASVSPTAMDFIITRMVPDPRLAAPPATGTLFDLVDGPASMLFSAMIGVVIEGTSADPVGLLTPALSAWLKLVNDGPSQRRLRERLVAGVSTSSTKFSRREKAAVLDCISLFLGH